MAYKKSTNKMNKDEWLQKRTQEYLGQIADSLMQLHDRSEELASQWKKPWANTDNFNQMNGLTEKTYRGRNGLKLWLSASLKGYQDPRWVTYNQIQEEGGNVRQGEKGTLIKFYSDTRTVNVRDEKGNLVYDENGKVLQKTEKTKPMVFFATVFNLEQCENIPKESKLSQPVVIPELDHVERVERAEHFLKASGVPISYDGGNKAFYKHDTDDVHLPPVDLFDSPSDYYHTAFHEITHWTGAASRLNRFDKPATKGSVEYAREEFVADLGAHLLARDFNLVGNSDMEKLMGYLSSWFKIISPADQTNAVTFKNEVIKALESGMESQNFLNQSVREYEKTHPEDIKMFKDRIELNIKNDEQMKFAVENMAVLDPETQKLFITYEHDVTLFKGLIDDYEDVFRKYTVIQSSKNQSLNSDDEAVTENVSENINPTSEEIKEELQKEPNAPDTVIAQSAKDELMEQNESLSQNLTSPANTISTENQQSLNSMPFQSNKDIYLNHVKNEILNATSKKWDYPFIKTKYNKKGGLYTQFELDNNKIFPNQSLQQYLILKETLDKEYKDPRWATENFILNNQGHVKSGERGLPVPGGKTLFNLEQCDGFPVNSALSKPFLPFDFKKQKLKIDYHKNAEEIISNVITSDKMLYVGGLRPCYVTNYNLFSLPHKEYFNSTEEYYHTMMHEFVHWTNGKFVTRSDPRHDEEMIADIGSIMLCKQLNLTNKNSFSNCQCYVDSWNQEALGRSLEDGIKYVIGKSYDAVKGMCCYLRDKEINEGKSQGNTSIENNFIPLKLTNTDQIEDVLSKGAVLNPLTEKFSVTYDHNITIFQDYIENYQEVKEKFNKVNSGRKVFVIEMRECNSSDAPINLFASKSGYNGDENYKCNLEYQTLNSDPEIVERYFDVDQAKEAFKERYGKSQLYEDESTISLQIFTLKQGKQGNDGNVITDKDTIIDISQESSDLIRRKISTEKTLAKMQQENGKKQISTTEQNEKLTQETNNTIDDIKQENRQDEKQTNSIESPKLRRGRR